MKNRVYVAAIAAAAMLAMPASALTIISNGANSSVTVSSADIQRDFIVFTDGSTANSNGLLAKLTMELIAFTANSFTFNYRFENTSESPAASSRLGQVGFNVTPGGPANNPAGNNFKVTSGASDYFKLASNNNGNFNGIGGREVCLSAKGGACNGGGNDGILSGVPNSKVGQLIFTYAGARSEITFSNFVTRWQAAQNGESASGGSVAIVPEPATWAMMIGGFGLIGGALRRRRQNGNAVLA